MSFKNMQNLNDFINYFKPKRKIVINFENIFNLAFVEKIKITC